jgi:hypothetical protein
VKIRRETSCEFAQICGDFGRVVRLVNDLELDNGVVDSALRGGEIAGYSFILYASFVLLRRLGCSTCIVRARMGRLRRGVRR